MAIFINNKTKGQFKFQTNTICIIEKISISGEIMHKKFIKYSFSGKLFKFNPRDGYFNFSKISSISSYNYVH